MTPTFHLHAQDCLAGMRDQEDGTVDVVVTSPPYNLGIAYGSYDDGQDRDSYLLWCCDWAREVHRLLKENGSFFLNVGASPSNPLFPHQVLLALTTPGFFHLQNTFHWIKSITIETTKEETISAGHFKPINSQRYVNDCHEYVFISPRQEMFLWTAVGLACPMPTSRTSSAGNTRGDTISAAGVTTGSSPTRPSPPATRTVRIPPVSHQPWWNSASASTERGRTRCSWTPFWASARPLWQPGKMNIARFIGYEIDEGYLQVAQERLNELETPDLFEV